MSYIINNSRGQLIVNLADGTINTTATSLTLVGRNIVNYGESENENYVYLLENFANDSPPNNAILGQLWYNSTTDVISAYDSANSWVALASQDYVQLGYDIGLATKEAERLKWILELSRMRFDAWRTMQASNRYIEKATL